MALPLVLVSSLFGFFSAEAFYRIYLYQTKPEYFLPLFENEPPSSVWYYQQSPYQYSGEFGYEYVPGEVSGGSIEDGKVLGCDDPFWVTNERGNIGRIKGSYDDADIKILVFGDSWTTILRKLPNGDRVNWPNLLQDVLERSLNRSVHVVNFGRDGYGVLQMFDLAAAKVKKWNPDLFVIAFITDDLTRDRFWRTTTVLDGHERIMQSVMPDPDPDWSTASDVYYTNSEATSEWCRDLLASQARGDRVVRELEETVLEGQRRSSMRVNPLNLSQSFVLDVIVHGNPFHTNLATAPPSLWPHHKMRSFAEDARIVANVRRLEETGVPYVLVHLAYYPELKRQHEFESVRGDEEQDMALVESLSRITGRPVYGTLDHVALPIKDPERFSKKFPDDHHPSLIGAKFYAQMVAEVLQRHGYVE